ncbi:MAG: 23S rRNA (guanosine(2251)-2'-O)-methyltransferase RlmB [Alishewanella sp.]|uniref:23S rRNA (guanosine(2251)-2'-O)-methyltransferase RlmB n=1 Tax=Gammaproteobacteria TaxID=1236 RepID=UPI001E3C728A|nr:MULTISPECIES: 23S rRNA (guanosine(2251)-2'-O)-methyltransferase RlmB [unclassified Rheinheimera]MCC5451352.1 23S rRNA (guanosine(2251)-2'-O)-methyltransferase RlmB [Rheinheimera sp. UJ51]MCF4008307.1 23S rRNA (guanosine(2251)-2'-O)-methyltransferase RlmB [Rheinheimera sp. UJ63]MDP4944598.1 23S rRNA (guanosine(2251)-2'-O)-methyltransferase RlmB [Alishewanella sp.]MDP5036793.1 23S rRNA (guanosine(2251)-2'-O)-methyltransferase RlmB [Alishewanella sp.]
MSNDVVFGFHAVSAILERSPADVLEIFALKDREDKRMQPLLQQARQAGISIQFCNRRTLDDMTGGQHQGIVAKARLSSGGNEADLAALLESQTKPFLLVLDGVTDPHNLGAILRSADAAGVHAVIAPKDRSVKLTSVVRKVACGAAESVPFITVTNLARTLRQLQEAGVWVVGTAGETETLVYQADLQGPLALVLGAEGEGLRRLTRETCDVLVKIPMFGSVSSLNVSVATGICLFEAVRQRAQ